MSILRPVLLASDADTADLRGAPRVAARSAHARLALAASAQRSHAELGVLAKGEHDAPLPTNGWHWSISHARGYSAGVVARAPVGIDVEAIVPRRQELVQRVALRAELDLLEGFRWETFFRIWTAKEAVLKKAGCGILELSSCTIVAAPALDHLILAHRGREHAVRLLVRDGHVAAIACDTASEVEWTLEPAREVSA